MYKVYITKIDKKYKKAFKIPVKSIINQALIEPKDLEMYAEKIVDDLIGSDSKETARISFVIEHLEDTISRTHTPEGTKYTFEDIELRSTDATPNGSGLIIPEKISEDMSDGTGNNDEVDLMLPRVFEESINKQNETGFNSSFQDNDKNDESSEIQSPRDFDKKYGFDSTSPIVEESTVATEETNDSNFDGIVVSPSDEEIIDPFATPRGNNPISLTGKDPFNKPDFVTPTEEQKTEEQKQKNSNIIETSAKGLKYDEYVDTTLANESVLDVSNKLFSKENILKSFGVPADKSQLEKDDYKFLSIHDFVTGRLSTSDMVLTEYVKEINDLKAKVRNKLAEAIREKTDAEETSTKIDELLNAAVEEEGSKLKSDFDEQKSDLEDLRNVEIARLEEQQKLEEESALNKIRSEFKAKLDRVKTEYDKNQQKLIDSMSEKLDEYTNQQRERLRDNLIRESNEELMSIKEGLVQEAENKVIKINDKYQQQLEQIVTETRKDLLKELPTIESNALTRKELDLKEKKQTTELDQKQQQIDAKNEQMLASLKSGSNQQPVNIVMPSSNGDDNTAAIEEMREEFKKQLKSVNEQNILDKKKSKKIITILLSIFGSAALVSIIAGGILFMNNQNQYYQQQLNQIKQEQVSEKSRHKSKSHSDSLASLLDKKDYVKAYERYQDNDSLMKIAQRMYDNKDTAALKVFTGKFDLKLANINLAILNNDKNSLVNLNGLLSEEDKKDLNKTQQDALNSAQNEHDEAIKKQKTQNLDMAL